MQVAIVRCPDNFAYNDIDVKEEVFAGYAAATLEEAGFRYEVFDFKLNRSLRPTSVLESSPRLIAIPVRHPGDNLFYARRFVRQLRGLGGTIPHITLFGHANVAVEQNLKDYGFSTVILGEEPELVSLASAIESGTSFRDIPGIAFLKSDGSVQRNRPPAPQDLDELPWPKRYHLESIG